MSDTIGVDGVSVLRMTDMWSMRRWQQQLNGPVTGWENLHAAIVNTTKGYEKLLAELVPARWSGAAAEQYQRHQRHLYHCAEDIAVYASVVPDLLRKIEAALRQSTDTLAGQYESLTAQVPARRREGILVEFRVSSEAQARTVYRAVAQAQAVRRDAGAFVQEQLAGVADGTARLQEVIRGWGSVPSGLPGSADPDRMAPDPGSSAS